jgi:hypothetical protein
MIITHKWNSEWWGKPVGLVTDGAWFAQNDSERAKSLEPYDWVEFKAPLNLAPRAVDLCRAGFAWTDSQITFRISLSAVPDAPALAPFECLSAAEQPFRLETTDIRPFQHERFLQLPGVTNDMLSERYADWANDLIAAQPESCLRMTLNGQTQGWFLAQRKGGSFELTLAMLASDAVVSGLHLYQRSMRELAARGGLVGHAGFSVRNTPVLNILANLGARFVATNGVWLWNRK